MAAPRVVKSAAWLLLATCVGCAAPPAGKPVAPVKAPVPPARPAAAPAPPPPVASMPAPPAPSKAEHELALGIQNYDDGEYKLAARQLQSALEDGLDSKRDEAKAHKYLAFIVCASGREKSCHDHFRKALEADPGFTLEPAEAGNPIWSAALRSVKAERARAKPK